MEKDGSVSLASVIRVGVQRRDQPQDKTHLRTACLLLMSSLSSRGALSLPIPCRAQGRSVMQSASSDLGIPVGVLLCFP